MEKKRSSAKNTYDSFGKLTASTGTLTNPLQYTAREFDLETNMHYYRARYYDQARGRFLSEDPIRSGMNFYAYVHNSAATLVDPFGLKDNASPWQVGWEWLTGRGPRVHNFIDGDPFTELLRQHQHIQELINAVCNGTAPPKGRFDYSLSGGKEFRNISMTIRRCSLLGTRAISL
jgi:RHS repeat-associated protein